MKKLLICIFLLGALLFCAACEPAPPVDLSTTAVTTDPGTSTTEPSVTPTEKITWTVTFVDADGNVLATRKVENGAAAKAPLAPTLTGHTFTGWDTDFSAVTSDLTVQAQFAPNSYTVTFDTKGGSPIDPLTVVYDTPLVLPADPVREGFTFRGWTLGEEAFTATVMPAKDLTLVAVWGFEIPAQYAPYLEALSSASAVSVTSQGKLVSETLGLTLTSTLSIVKNGSKYDVVSTREHVAPLGSATPIVKDERSFSVTVLPTPEFASLSDDAMALSADYTAVGMTFSVLEDRTDTIRIKMEIADCDVAAFFGTDLGYTGVSMTWLFQKDGKLPLSLLMKATASAGELTVTASFNY